MASVREEVVLSVRVEGAEQLDKAFSAVSKQTAVMERYGRVLADAAASGKVSADTASRIASSFGLAERPVKAAAQSMQGWQDAMRQAEDRVSTLPQKLELVRTKLAQLAAQGQQGGATWMAYTSELKRLSDEQVKLASVATGSVNANKNLGFVMQNASYQVTDFMVSVQGGTTAVRALGQQLPQFIQAFTILSPAIAAVAIPLTLLSAAIPFVVASFKAMWPTAKDTTVALDGMEQALSGIDEVTRTFDMENVRREFNASDANVRASIVSLNQYKLAMLELTAGEGLESLQAKFKKLGEFGFFDKVKGAFGASAAEKAVKEFGVSFETATKMIAAGRREISDAGALFDELRTGLEAGGPAARELAAELAKIAKVQRDSAAAQSAITKFLDDAAKAGAKGLVPTKERAKATREERQAVDDLAREYERLVKSVFTPEQTFQETIANIELVNEKYKLPLDTYQRLIDKATELRSAANFKEAADALDPFNRGLLAAGESMAKAANDAEALRGRLEYLSALEIGTEQYYEFAKSLGKAAPLADQARVAIAAMRDETKGLDAMRVVVEKMAKDFNLTAEEAKKLKQALGLTTELDELTRMMEQLGDKITGTVSGAVNGLIDNFGKAKFSFSSFAEAFVKDVAKMIVQFTVMIPLAKALKDSLNGFSGLGGLFGLTKSANGNIFDSLKLPQGVYNSPTFFPMAGAGFHKFAMGGVGVLGEAGPEAILPLKRSASGKLGVEGGGRTVINVNNYAPVEVSTSERTAPNGDRMLDIMIEQKMNRAIANGRLDTTMRSAFGVTRKGV